MTDGAEALRSRLGGLGRGFGSIVAAWAESAGPELARVATPTSLRDGTLTLRCTSASWAQSINLMEAELVDRLASTLGRGTVRRINARAGGAPPAAEPPPPAAPAPPLDPATEARLEAMVAGVPDPELRASLLAAARATEARRLDRRNSAS